MKTTKTFSCGRGVHRLFVFDGMMVVQTGWVCYSKYSLASITIGNKLGLLDRVKATLSYLNHSKSDYMSDTTETTAKDLKEIA